MHISYPFSIEPDETGGYNVQCLDMSNVFTCGDTIEDCLFNASEVLTAMLEQFLDDNADFPAPTLGLNDAYYVAPDARTQAAVLIRLSRWAANHIGNCTNT